MGWRIDIQTDNVAQLVDEPRVSGEFELFHPVRLRPCARQMRWTELALMPTTFAIMAEVRGSPRWVGRSG